MRSAHRLLPLLLLVSVSSVTAQVSQADVQAHKDRMLAAQELKFAIIERLAADSTEGVEQDLRALDPLLQAEIDYWGKTGLDDIVHLARDNLDQVRALHSSVSIGRADLALAAWGEVERTCSGCHDLHPERRVRVAGASPAPGH